MYDDDNGDWCRVDGWISVKDKLPEVRLDKLNFEISIVLVVSEKGSIQIQLASQLIETMIEGSYYYKIFTHWQPLPEPPNT